VQFAIAPTLPCEMPRRIRRFHPDVIHAHNLFFRTTELAAFLRLFSHTPLVVTHHLGRVEDSGWLGSLIRCYEASCGKFIFRRSDHITVVSNAVAEHVRSTGIDSKPLTVIPNGVDAQLFHPTPTPSNTGKVVLFVGRLVSNKGPEVLVRAAPTILSKHSNARFVMVGDGPMMKSLMTDSRHNGSSAAFQFLGTRHDVPELMRQATVFVRPSKLEGMPLTVLEAMASGLPVVATPAGGTRELVQEGVNGWLVPAGDSDALAKAVSSLLSNPDEAGQMGRSGRQMVKQHYSWDRTAELYEQVYSRVISHDHV
jgi:glycosyltransferase involved in cell wall biosynthesis